MALARQMGRAVTFKVRVETNFGDTIVLVGSGDELGNWDPHCGLKLTTAEGTYPLWSTAPVELPDEATARSREYKFVRLIEGGEVQWEAEGDNRRILPSMFDKHPRIVVDDGAFGDIRPEGSFVFPEGQAHRSAEPLDASVGRLVVAGDAAAAGHGAQDRDGWAAQLCESLHKRYGYGYSNVSGEGLAAQTAIDEFDARIASLKPSVVLLAFGLEVQRLATCPEHERGGCCEQLTQKLEALVDKVESIGALPVIGGLYPHAGYTPELNGVLQETAAKLRQFAARAAVLEWMQRVSDPGTNTWAPGVSHDAAHPNNEGHQRIARCIDASAFEPASVRARVAKREAALANEQVCFSDGNGFEIRYHAGLQELTVSNSTQNEYKLSPGWADMQAKLEATRREVPWVLRHGLYLSTEEPLVSFALGANGMVESEASISANSTITLRPAAALLEADPGLGIKVLFYDGKLGIIQKEESFMILNAADCEYNVHPMWQDVRLATRALPQGIYEDGSGAPFRTAVVSVHGLQSRVKVPRRSSIRLVRTGPLSSMPRVAVLPLGDRCSIRMLLHKIEYDGPCYPFDLTRTTALSDVADMIASGFSDMWNRDLLEYSHDMNRIYHRKWGGLSFAHEVEDNDDPIMNFWPVVDRMAKRYGGRAARFDYACKNADKVLFLRTGCASRNEVIDLLSRVSSRYPGMHGELLLISDQPSEEFQGLLGVRHVRENFDPDRMYEDMPYWIHSAHRFRGILYDNGITERNLYWCPNNLKEAEREVKEAADAAKNEAVAPVPPVPAAPLLTSEDRAFSHSKLYDFWTKQADCAKSEKVAAPQMAKEQEPFMRSQWVGA